MWNMILCIVIGFLAGTLGATALALIAVPLFNISQMEGAYAMGVAFFWVPLGAIAGTIAGAVMGWRTRNR
ncbi:MAG: hypothetical protein ACK4GW_09320 [Pseudorhodobacter sp.]